MISGDMPLTQTEAALQRLRTRIVLFRRERLDETWRFHLCSPFWRLYVNGNAGGFLRVGHRKMVLAPERVYAIPAWVPFATGLEQPVVQDYVHFYLEGLPQNWLRRLFGTPLDCGDDATLRGLVVEWRSAFTTTEVPVAHFFSTGALVQAVMARLWARLPKEAVAGIHDSVESVSLLQPAIACLEARVAEPPRNGELAALCGMSEDHFVRCFRAAVGLTPAQYGLNRRLDLAAEWLAQSTRPIDEIAERTGFTDRFHFSRTFRAKLGTPPAEFRRQHRRSPAPPSAK